MALPCSSNKVNIAAQTLFLGASVSDFNVNMSWGGRPAQLTVKLVEDRSTECMDIAPFPSANYADNHYHTCTTDSSCYIDEKGEPFNSLTSKERIVPGKVYYYWNSGMGFVSKYWNAPDPGFFGRKSDITNTGSYTRGSYSNSFDIINTPVIFRMGDFSFTGLVQSWEEDYSSGGLTYNLTIESMDSLLENCWIILDKHSGAVFAKLSGNTYGGPTNWSSMAQNLEFKGTIAAGNIPNVFNVYGFLESMGVGDFGGSLKNDNGISAALIMDALAALTSSSSPDDLNASGKRAFSPFGRILAKVAQTNDTYDRITEGFNNIGMGIFPVKNRDNQLRCEFVLDLSELPRPPLDFRISEPAISVISFIQQLTTATGSDFYFETIPATINGASHNVIKVKTITRSAQPNPRQIEATIQQFRDNGFSISSSRIGKEKNTNVSRVLYLGPQQQRLYQAKSYRLAYSQNQYIYHPTKKKFVEFYSNVAGFAAAGQPGKYRSPNFLSTRNPDIVNSFTNKYASLFAIDEDVKNAIDTTKFANTDSTWSDTSLAGNTRIGNYSKTISITKSTGEQVDTTSRFFPLYKDIICPFFGFKNEENFTINTTAGQSNVMRKIRPVWMDSWSGQIIVLMDMSEIPKTLSVPLVSPYGTGSTLFTITESEIRASDNLDSFITYCHGKIFTPDLFKMLKASYTASGKIIFDREITTVPAANGNAAGQMGQPTIPNPAPNALNIDFNIFFSQDFLRDLNILREFINKVGDNYGRKYLVRLPEIVAYKDQQYESSNIQSSLLTTGTAETLQVYHGSAKIFYNYEIASDGAWEEYGNIIDDSILVGSSHWYSLIDDNGKIQPLVAYNATEAKDYVIETMVNAGIANLGWDQYQLRTIINNIKTKVTNDPTNPNNYKYSTIDLSNLNPEDIVIKSAPVSTNDAYGESIGDTKKIYCKTRVDQDFVFLDPLNLRFPYAVIDAPGLSLSSTSKFFTEDPNNTVTAVASMEDLSIYLKLYNNPVASSDDTLTMILMARITRIVNSNEYVNFLATNNSVNHHRMRSKVAHPYFAAIPIKSNKYSYGPWTNYPDLDRALVFPGAGDSSDDALENLIGPVKVEVKSDYAPWNYGGMSFLDRAALNDIYGEVQYQQIIETATITMPGLPIFGIGSSFEYENPQPAEGQLNYNNQIYTASTITLNFQDLVRNPPITAGLPRFGNPVYNPVLDEPTLSSTSLDYVILVLSSASSPVSPIISNISCNISTQGAGTTYNFRTYTQKLSLFNKENSDRIKLAGLNTIKANKQVANLSQSFNNRLYQDTRRIGRDTTERKYDAERFQSGFYGTSPANVLVGMAVPFAYAPVNVAAMANGMRAGNSSNTTREYSLLYGSDPGKTKIESLLGSSKLLALMNDVRWNTFVGSYMSSEAIPELGQHYSLKSAMSYDGIFSPISLYPVRFNASYNILKHTRKYCTECNGTGSITDTVFDYTSNTKTTIPYRCPYCDIKKAELLASKTSSASKTESLPPYIITNSNDINTILQLESGTSNSSTDTTKRTGLTVPINAVSLQPIVVPYGEFKNNNVQSDDRCRHCIAVVARGLTPPKNGVQHNINANLKRFFDPNTGQVSTTNGEGVNADYYAFDIMAKIDPTNTNAGKITMNQRFFGLRGPLMLHAWGYDTEGYPVPNASDEPQFIDNNGRPARFALEIKDKGNVKYKDLKIGDTFIVGTALPENYSELVYYTKTTNTQIRDNKNDWIIPTDEQDVKKIEVKNNLNSDTSKEDDAWNQNGDIITKQYEWNGSKWIKKARSTNFHLNWAERPDIWPVGPVDLRWDSSRKVWTINTGSIFKFVYITLEEDLIKENDFDETYPTRGFLDDIEYSKDPLSQGYRRLVYVKDKTGYTAPRGVKLLCRYDSDSGFYEPISKPTIVAQGTVSSTNQASITMDYAQGNRAVASPVLTAIFGNPLGFNVRSGQRAMFTYVRGEWILTSVAQ